MNAAVRGRLITAAFIRDVLPYLPGANAAPPSFHRAVAIWCERREAMVGPASSLRVLVDVVVVPLLEMLGHSIVKRIDSAGSSVLTAASGANDTLTVVVVGWNELLGRAWRATVLRAIAMDGRWCACCNGRDLRIVDAHRTWSREYLEFDLARLGADEHGRNVLWTLLRKEAVSGPEPLLDRAVEMSAKHGVEVCRALGAGVLDGLKVLFAALSAKRPARQPSDAIFEYSLTILYRVLFLLFAEARRLVPIWHPVYRDRYSIDAIVSTLLSGRPYPGLWQAINAISRLANSGCSAGDLRVTAFNGRLFAASHDAAFDTRRLDDIVIGEAVRSVSTARIGRRGTAAKIVYRDLDVEQLGSVYEQVLEYEPASSGPSVELRRTGDARKSTGSFYTPKAVTAHLVQRTLEPLVRNRSSHQILELRVLDPAMGSGAFLVAACRYLASAVEEALIREGRWHSGDVTLEDRTALRRDIASRCLFGVDLNPMAVQLARLSIWLATLAADKPLSFLDHHLVTGDSLVGATPEDVRRQPGRSSGPRKRPERLPLFQSDVLSTALQEAVRVRLSLAADADDTASIVRAKEQALAALRAPTTMLSRWSRVLDLWCAGWFWPAQPPPDRATFHQLLDRVLHGGSTLPERLVEPLIGQVTRIAEHRRFLHWPLVFPEVFLDTDGTPLSNPGFDAVLGNPPWDMVRGDSGEGDSRDERRRDARRMIDFVREAGIYQVESHAHLNRYQLFLERALQLLKTGGRLGFVLPSGAMTDAGTAALRRHVFDRAGVDALVGLDNRHRLFQAHRSLRFVLLSCTAGRPTTEINCRFGLTSAEDIDSLAAPGALMLPLTRRFLSRLSGDDDLGVPELATEMDWRIVERISATVPWLGECTAGAPGPAGSGWNVRFGRELNASDDRDAFAPITGHPLARPVVEGKLISPFRVSLERCRLEVPASNQTVSVPRRARLAYRDVASSTNRLTLIAAVVPPMAVTTHTLSCLRNPLALAEQRVLCALLNSFVANYLIRLRVNTHVTAALISRLPVPIVRVGHPLFPRLASLAGALMLGAAPVEQMPEYAELQALVARLYGLTAEEFEHMLSTFPLIEPEIKRAVLLKFNDSQ